MSRDDARARILMAAGPVFAERGYQAATVRQICQEADVNVAAVNYYFGDKERLYVETVKHAHRPPAAELPEALQWPEGTPTRTKLRDYLRGMMTRITSEQAPWQRQLMMREMLNPTVACRELVRTYIRVRFEQLLEILDELLPAEMPDYRRHQVAFSVIGQVLHYHVSGEVVTLLVGEEERTAHYDTEALVEHITQFTMAALGADSLSGTYR